MKHFNFYHSLYIFFAIFFTSISFPLFVHAQVSLEQLFITNINQYDVYPYITGGFGGVPGLCVLGSFSSPQETQVQIRTVPFSMINNPVWIYSNPLSIISPSSGVNATFGNSLDPTTEYVVQVLEVAQDGTRHLITPNNPGDDITSMCTPSPNGTIWEICPLGDFVLSGTCDTATLLSALGNGVTISNVQNTEDTISFSVNAQTIDIGQDLYVVYSTSPTQIVAEDFEGLSNTMATVNTGNQTNIPFSFIGLQANTTYYFTVLNSAQAIILTTANNQGYEVFSTTGTGAGTNSGTTGLGEAGTINVNLDGTFGQTELTGENIESGLIQCGFGDNYDCDFNAALATIDRIIKFLLYIIVLPLAAILFAWAGIKLIIAKAKSKESEFSKAKELFTGVILGLVFALSAWIIVKFVLVILGYTDASGIITQVLGITT